MFIWFSTNLVNIILVTAIVLLVGLLIRGMIRDKKAGKSSCGGNCASCGACAGCSSCSKCSTMNAVHASESTSRK